MEETWKSVVGYEGLYEVSSLGRVRSLRKKKFYYKKYIMNRGYAHTGLSKYNKINNFYFHRLVAQAFIPNPDKKKEVNHIDFNRINNNISNLEWVTRKENVHHSIKAGRHSPPPIGVRYAKRESTQSCVTS